ncbi:hypothetical protein Q7P37_009506 [Cladosporium fusiforme]
MEQSQQRHARTTSNQPTDSHSKPTRSRTDPEEQPQRSHARNLSKKLHAHSIRSKAHGHKPHRSVRHAAKDTVQSAIDIKPPVSFDAILRRGDKRSPDSSRRGSTNPQSQLQQDWDFAQQQAEAEKRRVNPADVQKLRRENEKREVELRAALKKVEELGMQNTRQLDDTYYSILEKAESMRNTLAEMQRLADESRKARAQFEEDTKEIESSTIKTMEAFGEFKTQEETIDGYVTRLAESKAKTEGLNERLEGARKRVEAYEKGYREAQAKRRKQWHITWGSLAAVVVLMLALVIAQNYRHIGYQSRGIGKVMVEVGDAVGDAVSPVTQKLKPSPSEDPVLRDMFEKVV